MRDDPLSTGEIAREIGISPFHFIRQFGAVFGSTPHQFRIRSRLDRARLLLATGRYSVANVCLEVGFASLGSFSYLFTRRVGATPSAYEKRARTLISSARRPFADPVSGMPEPDGQTSSGGVSQFSRSAGFGCFVRMRNAAEEDLKCESN